MSNLLKRSFLMIPLVLVYLMLSARSILAESLEDPPAQTEDRSPAALIQAVNDLRLENGLNALNPHPSLMAVAQWEADAIAGGAPGHVRPEGLTLGAWMISQGYPLAGSIPLDGLRSENWVGGREMTVDQAIISWLGDAPHTNTMLSPDRSDIGAGVSIRQDEDGSTVYIYVIETALQTSDGQQQYEALLLLTAIPQTQTALYGGGTQAAQAQLVPQYMVPVSQATARPDGDVIHQVQYGQTLWSIAIAYGVKIDDIKLLNNIKTNEVWTNQQLLIQKGATQPAYVSSATPVPTARKLTPTPSPTVRLTAIPTGEVSEVESAPNTTLILFIILVLLVPGMLIGIFLRESKSSPKPPDLRDP
jgi:LysM repeat protein